MTTYYEDDLVTVYHGDCLEELKKLGDCSVDAVITDPPYGLSNTKPAQVADVLAAWVTGDTKVVPELSKGFMGKTWDGFVPPPAVWEECLRVLKPGGHMAVFAGARTQDLMGLSIRLAGFEIRDTLGWIYGSGFPKSMDISKAVDKGQALSKARALEFTEWMRSTGITATQINEATNTNMGNHYLTNRTQPAIATADLFDKLRPLLPEVPERIERLVAERTGIEWSDYVKREVVGKHQSGLHTGPSGVGGHGEGGAITTSASDEAKKWEGWGTALKPAIEPIILARKPLAGTVAANVLEHGVGGLNIDASRVGTDVTVTKRPVAKSDGKVHGKFNGGEDTENPAGRFPANVLLDEHAAEELDKQSGVSVSRANTYSDGRKQKSATAAMNPGVGRRDPSNSHSDSGGASRFFPVFKYQAKAPKKERPVIERDDGTKVQHPTVKPLALMEWLTTLITPPEGVILDPFAGTGTTLQAATNTGHRSIGIEADSDYIQLIHKRLDGGEQAPRTVELFGITRRELDEQNLAEEL